MASAAAAAAATGNRQPTLNLDVLIQVPWLQTPGAISRMLTSIRACLRARTVEAAAADVIHCSPSAGKPQRPRVFVLGVHLTDRDSQCTKAGKECVFFDHGRNEFLPRR
jgi:hypothetical protein